MTSRNVYGGGEVSGDGIGAGLMGLQLGPGNRELEEPRVARRERG